MMAGNENNDACPMSTEATPIDTAIRPTWVRWRILGVLVFVSFVSYLLRGNLSIAAPSMIADLKLSEVQWGWIMSAFPLGYALFQFPGGLFGDRVGPRLGLMLITLAWGVLIALTSLVPGPDVVPTAVTIGSLLTVQFFVGAVHAPVYPVMNCAVHRWFPLGGFALPLGLTSSGLTIGLAATASLLPWLIGQHGWRESFLILAPAGLAAAALWWWYGRDDPSRHHATNAAEIRLIQCGRIETERGPRGQPAWLRTLKNRDVLLLTLSYSCMNFVFYVVFSWGFYYLVRERGFGEQEAGFLTSSQWLLAGAGAALGGWLADFFAGRFGYRWGGRWSIMIGNVASGVLLFGVAVHPNPYAAAIMLGLCFFFNQSTEGGYWGNSIAIGGRHAGAAGGLMNTGANLMGFVNAVLLSSVASVFGWTIAMEIGAGFALLAAVLMLAVRADRQMDQRS